MRSIAAAALTLTFLLHTGSASANPFGKKSKDASVTTMQGKVFKGKTTLALGSFRVAFMTKDSVRAESHGMFANGGSSAMMTGELAGIDHATMQKIADQVYADFLKQASAKGYTVLDSNKVAAASGAYRDLAQTVNYADSRIGTLVIPTGQRSVALAADDSAKDSKGASGMMSSIHALGKSTAKAEANKAFPAAAKDLGGVPVLGVTIVVNFATFRAKSDSFGSSKVAVAPGATIDGQSDAALDTSILAWDGSVCAAAVPCEARLALQGFLHSDTPIGSTSTYGKWGMRDAVKKAAVLEADPELYEKGVLEVAPEANALLIDAMAKER